MKQTLFNIPEYNLEIDNVSKTQRDFRPTYQTNGFKELGSDNLKTFINIKYKVDRLQENYNKISQECDALKQAILRQVFD